MPRVLVILPDGFEILEAAAVLEAGKRRTEAYDAAVEDAEERLEQQGELETALTFYAELYDQQPNNIVYANNYCRILERLKLFGLSSPAILLILVVLVIPVGWLPPYPFSAQRR